MGLDPLNKLLYIQESFVEIEELGPLYFDERFESDIESINDSANGLFIIIESKNELGKDMRLKLSFELSMAYRYLDEADLSYYWDTGLFSSRYHVYQILNGGWSNGEPRHKGVMVFTDACKNKEYFVATSNGCMNVVSDNPPVIEILNI